MEPTRRIRKCKSCVLFRLGTSLELTVTNTFLSYKCRYRRNKLFEISGIRANYPQFFLVNEDEAMPRFLGDWETIEAVNDASSLPDEILEANPSIMTWENVLG